MFARKEWIAACHFHALDDAGVMRTVVERVRHEREKHPGDHVVTVFDIDSTLYEVKTRTHQILKEWVASHPAGALSNAVREVLHRMEEGDVGYSMGDTFRALGLALEHQEVANALAAARRFWKDRFFTNDYLQYDRVYAGATGFVHRVFEAGSHIVYLTGRDEPGMGAGTRQRLRDDGFPIDAQRTRLILKANFDIEDMAHKQDATRLIGSMGRVVASFENEPRNLVALHQAFPEAMHVFLDTDCSEHPALPLTGLYRLTGFGA